MAARVQLEQVKLEGFNPDTIIHKAAYSSCKTSFFHAHNENDHLQFCHESPLYSNFSLPWQCDIIEYSSIALLS